MTDYNKPPKKSDKRHAKEVDYAYKFTPPYRLMLISGLFMAAVLVLSLVFMLLV